MKIAKTTIMAAAFLISNMYLSAQIAPVCDSGGVCGTNPSDPSYGGLLAARPLVQNARGTGNPMAALSPNLEIPKTVIGSQSYNRAFPILSLPGRGLNLNLTLYYSSRIWTVDTADSTVSLNTDRDFPSYGFRLDFGYLENNAINHQYILTEADGTKHSLVLTGTASFDSIDGTFIHYNSQSLLLTYRNGRMVQYQAFPSQTTLFRPIQIMDTNRNFITVAYVTGTGNDQHIDSITDTLNRVIKFNYVQNQLQSITQAVSTSTDPSGTHTWATFSWSSPASPVILSYNFSGLAPISTPASGTAINVLTGFSYANQTGIKFSYGSWGIVNRIDLLSSAGTTRSYQAYNFPDASQALSDSPRYTQLTASPDGTASSVWNYSVTQSGVGQVTGETITDPLGTASIITVNSDGTTASMQIKDVSGKVFQSRAFSWTKIGSNTLLTGTTTTDDAGNSSLVSFGYDSFGNINDKKEYDFNNQLIRETVTSYKGSPFTDQHILNLPQSIQVKDQSGAVKGRTDFDYDTVARTAITGGVVQNDGNSTAARGNLTSVTRYSDPVTPGGGITRLFTYDIAGNLVIAQLDCCTQKKFTFDPLTQFAYLSSVVRGPDTGQNFTNAFNFNPDNGLLQSAGDDNGQNTSYQYDNIYRIKSVTPPLSNGLSTTQYLGYSDGAVSPQVITTTDANGTKIVQTFDGLGHITRQDTIDRTNGNTVSTTQLQYDEIWRRKKISNPYAGAEPVLWNTTAYDAMNRATSMTPPSGGATSFNFAGNTVLITDPAGKQRKNFFDGLGRLVRVDEPGWGDALPAIDSISISGGERSKLVSTRYCAQYTIGNPPRCVDWEFQTDTNYDTGNVTATINGVAYTNPYGQNDSSSTIATNLAGKINADPARVVNASPSGSTINLYAVNPGAGGNSISVSASSVTTDTSDFAAGSTSFPASTFTPTLAGGENAVAQSNAVLSATRHLTTAYGYDVFDHLTATSQGAIGPINGQQLQGQSRSYAYDALGRLVSSTTPESGVVTNYYTKSDGTTCSGDPSLVCRTVDARNVTKTFIYNDSLNRLTGITYSDGTTPSVSYAYDTGGQTAFALGRLVQVTETPNAPAQPTSEGYTYDNLGRITSISAVVDGTTYPVSYSYNPANQISNLTYPTGRVVYDNYDGVGRLQNISNGGVAQFTVGSYNGAMQATAIAYPNNIQGLLSYDDHLQISTLRYYNSNAPAGTQDVLNLSYDYTSGSSANTGQIQVMHYYTAPGVEDKTKSESFSYDPWSRVGQAQTLDQTTNGAWSLQWAYDRLGNRMSQAGTGSATVYQPNFNIDPATNRIIGYCYDAAGNLIDESSCPAGSHRYTYDGGGRLTSVNNGSATATYTYLGPFRVKKSAGGTTTIYIYSGAKPIAEYVGGQISREYIYAGSRMVATVIGTAFTYHHPDHLSNRAETDGSGAVTRRFGHFPFGEVWYESPGSDKWKFTTYERDSGASETGLDYSVFRYYGSGQGRFISPDLLAGQVEIPQSMNRYSYVLNDPIDLRDLLGLDDDCGGPCNPFTIDMGFGCVMQVTYEKVQGQDGKTYDMPKFSMSCPNQGHGSSTPCARPNIVQRAGIRVQRFLSIDNNRAIGVGASVSAGGGHIIGAAGGASAQVWTFPDGSAGLVYTWGTNTAPMSPTGVGLTEGLGFLIGFTGSLSDAKTLNDFNGPGIDFAASAADGPGLGVDMSFSQDLSTTTQNFTFGFGLGGKGGAGIFQDSIVVPFCSF